MNEKRIEILRNTLQDGHYKKLMEIKNTPLHQFVAEYIELCKPDTVYICTDSQEDLQYIRESAVRNGEEEKLAIEGHTIHFDGYHDQARDKAHTQFLLPKGVDLGPFINGIDKEEGLKEIKKILKNIMEDKTLYVRFFCLGPTQSEFSMLSVQLTDSAYVAHSLDLLYRQGYEEFKRQGEKAKFFRIVHSAGKLENGVSKNVSDRRIYIDTEEGVVYSANTQYGGNTLGLKKLSMRLAIKRASEEGWLCEHMFVMGVHGNHDRVTYFTGAFPSLCGKTSTSTLVGETIVGDDIAYLRKRDGKVYAVNVEKGMFGIIMGVNSKDDPIIWKALNKPNEIIFSNVLKLEDGSVYWIGKDTEIPEKGVNYSGEWTLGKRDEKGNEITPSHKNARFTLDLKCLENVNSEIDNPLGVHVKGIIYGGRDSNTWVPVREAFNWKHGIISIASALESETTAATLGKEGVPKLNPMSNLDFIPIPLGQYIQINLDFGCYIENPPLIFGVNYFLQDKKGNFVNERVDKKIWLKWMEQRVHREVEAIDTPVGRIPVYQDLKRLFYDLLGKEYPEEDYVQQFTIRVNEFLNKIRRVVDIYKTKAPTTPNVLFEIAAEETQRLNEARAQFGDYIAPQKFIH